jgi:hypothetical protein
MAKERTQIQAYQAGARYPLIVRMIFGGLLLLLWLATAATMWRDQVRDPYDASLVGTARYGHNHDGALRDGLVAASIELVLAIALFAPWAAPSVGRAVLGLLLAASWTLSSMMLSMHGGGVVAIHFLWMGALTLWFLALAIASGRVNPAATPYR